MLKGNISKAEVMENPDLVLDVLEFTHNQSKKAEEAAKASTDEPLPPEKTITLSKFSLLLSIIWVFCRVLLCDASSYAFNNLNV